MALRLKALSEEAAQLASSLAPAAPAVLHPKERRRQRSAEEVLRLLIDIRRSRYRAIPADLFTDPAWDMLLDLMVARLAGRQVTVSSLCVAAGVPTTTALRWINALADAGLVRRVADRHDRRRVHVELTEEGEQRMDTYLRSIRRLLS